MQIKENRDVVEKTIPQSKMKVEIWSDITCPFCYIGKRNFEQALFRFSEKARIEVEWKSFQLAPAIPEVPEYQNDLYRFVAVRKGFTYEQSKKVHDDLAHTAKEAGLEYNFDKAIITNSLKGHKLIQYAKTKGYGDRAEERLFFGYFTQGKNLNDSTTLVELGEDIGLTADEVNEALSNPRYKTLVEEEGREAQSLGAKGIPFFVIDGKYALAGAQAPDSILLAMEKAFVGWKKENPGLMNVGQGAVCVPDGDCK